MSRGLSFAGRLWNEMNQLQRMKYIAEIYSPAIAKKHVAVSWEELPGTTKDYFEFALKRKILGDDD